MKINFDALVRKNEILQTIISSTFGDFDYNIYDIKYNENLLDYITVVNPFLLMAIANKYRKGEMLFHSSYNDNDIKCVCVVWINNIDYVYIGISAKDYYYMKKNRPHAFTVLKYLYDYE